MKIRGPISKIDFLQFLVINSQTCHSFSAQRGTAIPPEIVLELHFLQFHAGWIAGNAIQELKIRGDNSPNCTFPAIPCHHFANLCHSFPSQRKLHGRYNSGKWNCTGIAVPAIPVTAQNKHTVKLTLLCTDKTTLVLQHQAGWHPIGL